MQPIPTQPDPITMQEVRELKQEMEQELLSNLDRIFSDFESRTGLMINSIDVSMIDVTTIEDMPKRRYKIGRVEVRVEF